MIRINIKENSKNILSLLLTATIALPLILTPATANNHYTAIWDKAWAAEHKKPKNQRMSPAKLISKLAREKKLNPGHFKQELADAGRIKVRKARDTRKAKKYQTQQLRTAKHNANTEVVRQSQELAGLTPEQRKQHQFYTGLNRKVKQGKMSLAQQQLAILANYNGSLSTTEVATAPAQRAQPVVQQVALGYQAPAKPVAAAKAVIATATAIRPGLAAPSGRQNPEDNLKPTDVPVSGADLVLYEGALSQGKVWVVVDFNLDRFGPRPEKST